MYILEILCVAILIGVVINIFFSIRKAVPIDIEKLKIEFSNEIEIRQTKVKNEIADEIRASRTEMSTMVQATMKNYAESLTAVQNQTADRQDVRLRELTESISKNQDLMKIDIGEKMLSLQTSQSESILALQKSVVETTEMISKAQ